MRGREYPAARSFYLRYCKKTSTIYVGLPSVWCRHSVDGQLMKKFWSVLRRKNNRPRGLDAFIIKSEAKERLKAPFIVPPEEVYSRGTALSVGHMVEQ